MAASGGQSAESKTQIAAFQAKVDALAGNLCDRDQEVRARPLYLYCRGLRCGKDRDTEKPFGRVFYTQDKSLIFYAYDLDRKAGIHQTASTFEAWGRRCPDWEYAVKLGILYQDNASKKRWVAKSNDPRTLAQIDAVFVTIEPNGGSAHPSEKPFLFAHLKVDPNHPKRPITASPSRRVATGALRVALNSD